MRTLSLLIFCFSLSVHAAGGEEAAPAATSVSTTSEDREYREKSAKLAGLEAKIKDLNTQLTQLVESKRKEKDPEKLRELMDELVSKTKERNNAAKEHRRLKNDLVYKYPNLGESIHKKYGTHEDTSIEQLERARGLDELLTEAKKLIQEKYAPFIKEPVQSKENSGLDKATREKEKQKLRLVK